MPRLARSIKKTPEKPLKCFVCLKCNETKTEKEFYKSAFTVTPYCKECLLKMCIAPSGEFSIQSTKECLHLINRPYYYTKLLSLDEDKTMPVVTKVQKYFHWLALGNRLNQTWEHSQDENYADPLIEAQKNEAFPEKRSREDEKIKRWNTKSKSKIQWLEEEYDEWIKTSPIPVTTKGQKELIEQMCLTKWQISLLQKEGKDVPTKLYDTYQKLMTNAGLQPTQDSTSENEQITFGTLIRSIENERPILPLNNGIDHFDRLQIWIVGQLAKMQGITGSIVDDYDKILKEYNISDIEEQFVDNVDQQNEDDEGEEDLVE